MVDYQRNATNSREEEFVGGAVALLQQAVRLFGKRPFLIDEKRIYSFLETDEISTRLSCGLRRLGLKRGEKVILYLEGRAEFIFSSLAVQKSGALVVPLNNDLAIPKVQEIMHDVEAEWLIIGETLLPVLQKATFPNLPGRVVIVGEVPPGFKAESYQRVLEEGGQETPPLNAELDDDVAICYTSGTTGCPKGVVYRHRNALASGRWVARITKMQFSDVLLTAIPMYISSNFNGHFLASLMRGVPLVLLKRFDPKNVLTKLKAHKVTIFHGTGNMYTELFKYKNFSAYDLPSLRMLTWSNILPAALLTRMRVDFPGVEIMQFYGFAEGGPVGTCINLQELFQRPGSCGRIEPEMANFRVVDEMENDVPTGEIGEIIYQGPGLMRAYYRNPQMTAKAIRNGWYYTGDLGKIDQDGFLYVVGRNKDIIYCDGKRVYPAEVEEVLFKHPSVLDVAVVGVPRATSGEEVKAFVVLKEGDYATEEDMIVYCQKANLAPYKIPAKVEFRKTFPKSSMGKTLKNELL